MNKQNKSAFRDSLEKGQSCGQIAMGREEKYNQSVWRATECVSYLSTFNFSGETFVFLEQNPPLMPEGCFSFSSQAKKKNCLS